MRPKELTTKIFLDSANPEETREAITLLGFLDGQTTNPTLISRHPKAEDKILRGEKFKKDEAILFYKELAEEISSLIPEGSVSLEVLCDRAASSDEMLSQARKMFHWIHNAHIKLPITIAGLEAAEAATREGIRINMTLCFSQEQAAAVYAATEGAKKGQIFLSPFVGRIEDDTGGGFNGMNLIKNILDMYRAGNRHVEVLASSIRTIEHLYAAIAIESDILTAPIKVLKEWSEKDCVLPPKDFSYQPPNLKPIAHRNITLERLWRDYDTHHELTQKGIDRFMQDWNEFVEK